MSLDVAVRKTNQERPVQQSEVGTRSRREDGALSPRLALLSLVSAVTFQLPAWSQTFSSGSTGADGALNLTTPGTVIFDPAAFSPALDPEGDNIYHFTTINIGAGVTVRLTSQKVSGPAVFLATGDVAIAGILDASGENGSTYSSQMENRRPAMPGPGGFPGGIGRTATSGAQNGGGPGAGSIASGQYSGGAGHYNVGSGGVSAVRGARYGNDFLVPLIGGSGGAGDAYIGSIPQYGHLSTGGAGGGAILIASSTAINLTGSVRANGGAAGTYAGGGSGGAIRLVANTVSGNGSLQVNGGSSGNGNPGSVGRTRIEANTYTFTGSIPSHTARSTPFSLHLPTVFPKVRVTSVAGLPVSATPTGQLNTPDVVFNSTTAVPVEIAATDIPLGTVVRLTLISEAGGELTVDCSPLAGTVANSTGAASVVFPSGYTLGYVKANWTP